jgi:hypothetical protein
MRTVRRIALGVGVVVVLGAAAAAWYVYGPVPVPDGYRFARHSMWGGGPAALYEGTLVEDDGCVRTADGFTVAWPPGYRLDVEDDELVVRGGGRTVRMGDQVRMGGGFYESEPLPDILSGASDSGCPMPFFLTTGWAD